MSKNNTPTSLSTTIREILEANISVTFYGDSDYDIAGIDETESQLLAAFEKHLPEKESGAMDRLNNINSTMDLLIEYLKSGGSSDIRVFNTWLGEQAGIAKKSVERKETLNDN